MAKLKDSAQRLALAGGFAFAVAAAPALAAFAVPAAGPMAACPAGQAVNPATGGCEVQPAAGPQGGLPQVNGIPCTGANTGQCIGLQQEQQAPAVQPRTTVSSSP
ncbi:intersectin-EH binding protein Ibp1 [Mycobacterium sp. RTGN5]|uniref:intersectin-EH binding protein Ibp1 n=1 Tax=Mycobacterium sp. RTGN5 TaxID=3016522 RepID=UPI0029C6400E|nr:intersectin-EH binding protein Ibp1 [Mycobacterium sp. RTGN5]